MHQKIWNALLYCSGKKHTVTAYIYTYTSTPASDNTLTDCNYLTDIGYLLLRLYLVKCHNKWLNNIWIFTKTILQSGDGNWNSFSPGYDLLLYSTTTWYFLSSRQHGLYSVRSTDCSQYVIAEVHKGSVLWMVVNNMYNYTDAITKPLKTNKHFIYTCI